MSIQIGVLIAIAGLLLSFLSYQLARFKEVKSDSRDSAELRTELGYIRKGVDDICIDTKANEKQMVICRNVSHAWKNLVNRRINGLIYSSQRRKNRMTTIKGIDVSDNNGVVDWDRVKKEGIKFAMLRLEFGSDIESQDDEQFERNVKECERLGIPWGAYLYSYALNVESAKSEVAHALRLLKGKHPSYPIAFDI